MSRPAAAHAPDAAASTASGTACRHPPGLLHPRVDRNRYEGKGPCVAACPCGVLEMGRITTAELRGLGWLGRAKAWAHGGVQVRVIDPAACEACGACVAACPERAITLVRSPPRDAV